MRFNLLADRHRTPHLTDTLMALGVARPQASAAAWPPFVRLGGWVWESVLRQTDKTRSGRFGPLQRVGAPCGCGWSQGTGRQVPCLNGTPVLRSASPTPPQCYIVIYIPN